MSLFYWLAQFLETLGRTLIPSMLSSKERVSMDTRPHSCCSLKWKPEKSVDCQPSARSRVALIQLVRWTKNWFSHRSRWLNYFLHTPLGFKSLIRHSISNGNSSLRREVDRKSLYSHFSMDSWREKKKMFLWLGSEPWAPRGSIICMWDHK